MKTHFFLVITFISTISLAKSNGTICTPNFEANISDTTQSEIVLLLLNNSKNLLEDAMKYAALKTSCFTEERSEGENFETEESSQNKSCSSQDKKPKDCATILEENADAKSGIHRIWPRSRLINGSIEVYCDMDDGERAWTVIQRRGNFGSDSEYFFKNWDAYKIGFGDLEKDFWLGNDKISALTNQESSTVKFVLTDWEGVTTYASYDDFWIEDETRNYMVHVIGYRGTAGDSFTHHNGSSFSTKDRDNDNSHSNCAGTYYGGWWYNSCRHSNLNGKYLQGNKDPIIDYGLIWGTLKGHFYSLKDTVIKIQPSLSKRIQDTTNQKTVSY